MSIELDFVKQLTTTKAVKEEANSINKKQIKAIQDKVYLSKQIFYFYLNIVLLDMQLIILKVQAII